MSLEEQTDFCQLVQDYLVYDDVLVFNDAAGYYFQLLRQLSVHCKFVYKQDSNVEVMLTKLLTQELVNFSLKNKFEPHFYLQVLVFKISGVYCFFNEEQIL